MLKTKNAGKNAGNAEHPWRSRGVDLSKLSGGLFALVTGVDVDGAAGSAGNVAEHNVLPLLIVITKIGIAAYTTYELVESAKKGYALYQRIQSGENFTQAELQQFALELGIEMTAGLVLSKMKILEGIADIAERSGLNDKAGDIMAYVKKKGDCSFRGDTQVLTMKGLLAIRDLRAGQHQVWSRNDVTGTMSFQPVTYQGWKPYEDTVYVTLRNSKTGVLQTIVSNRIHPFFTQIPAGEARLQQVSTAGHFYQGRIKNGAWVDAQYLKAGYRLLQSNENWSEVVGVRIEARPIQAYNITVANTHTYYVRSGDKANADPVWVHNCNKGAPTPQKSTFELPTTYTRGGGVAGTFSDNRYTFRLDTNRVQPEEKGFHIHVYYKGKEVAKVSGNGRWNNHGGETRWKPSEAPSIIRTDVNRLIRNARKNIKY